MNVIELNGVSCSRKRGGLRDITLEVQAGERIALFGGPGAGKTAILELLAGRLNPTSGEVLVLGRPPRTGSRLVGYSPEVPASSHSTSHQILTRHASGRGVTGQTRASRLVEALETCGLYEVRDVPSRDLSHTQKICLGIAAAIVHRPPVLLLDNPTSSLPPAISRRIQAYIERLRRETGVAVIHATTSSEEAEGADRVLLLDSGRALACDRPGSLLAKCARETVIIEATDSAAVQRTLRGVFDVEIEEFEGGLRIAAADGLAVAAHLFRHSAGEARVIYVKLPTLWDALNVIRDA